MYGKGYGELPIFEMSGQIIHLKNINNDTTIKEIRKLIASYYPIFKYPFLINIIDDTTLLDDDVKLKDLLDKKIYVMPNSYYPNEDIELLDSMKTCYENGTQHVIIDKVSHYIGYDKQFLSSYIRLTIHGPELLFKSFVPKMLREDKDIVLQIIKAKKHGIEYAPDAVRSNRDIMLEVVKINGHELQYASSTIREDKEIVLAAVNQNGLALEYASSALRADKEVVIVAILENIEAIEYSSFHIRNDPRVLAAIDQSIESIRTTVREFIENPQLINEMKGHVKRMYLNE